MNAINLKHLFIGAMALFLGGCGGEDSGGPSQSDGAPTTIVKLQVTPASSRIPVGFEQQLVAQALMSDSAVINVTTHPSVTWSSSDSGVVTVDNKGLVKGVNVGTATIKAAGTNASGQHVEATAQVDVTSATVTGLQVTPAIASVPAGLTQAFVATALLSDGSALVVTDFTGLTWSSSGNAIATISNDTGTKGQATGVSAGVVTITASGSANGQNFSATAELTVTNAHVTALQVTPATATTPVGLSQQFIATAILSDGAARDVTHEPALSWSSSNTATASISNDGDTKGSATGVKPGAVTITASGSVGGTAFTGTAQLTVTNAVPTQLVVTPVTTSTPAGFTQQFTASLKMSDGSVRDVTHEPALNWVSSDTSIATISSLGSDKGLATGVKPGAVTITASGSASGTAFSATAQLTVTDAVATQLVVTPVTASTPAGLTQQFIATLTLSDGATRDVTHEPALSWVSSVPTVATISNSAPDKGLATGVTAGTVTITASGYASGTPFSTTAEFIVTAAIPTQLVVTPVTATTPVGLTQPFIATLTLSDGTTRDVTHEPALSWVSSNISVATISSTDPDKGLATGVTVGATTITASGTANGTPFTASATLTVTGAIVTGLQVTPATASIAKGLTQQFTATAILSDGSAQDVTDNTVLSWGSSDPSIATIVSSQASGNGLATGENTGTVTITASGTVNGTSFTASAQLTVTSAIVTGLQVSPATASIAKGLAQQFTATATLSDGSTQDVTNNAALSWVSSNPSIATIVSSQASGNGLATGENTGTVSITASGSANGTPFTASAQLTVTNAVVTALQITPVAVSIAKGLAQQFTATVTLSDGSTQDMTNNAALSWVSSDPSVATIVSSQASGNGLATGVNPGNVTITASGTANSTPFTADAQLTVTNAVPTVLTVTPTSASTPAGLSQQFIATLTLSDGTTRDVTHEAALSWVSGNAAVATISSSGPTKGLATGVTPGSATITASGSVNGTPFTADTQLTVVSAIPTQLVVTPITATTPVGLTTQFIATLTLSDSTTRDVTHEAALSWSSSNPAVATISSSDPTKGLATGVTPGSATVTASGSVNGTSFTADATLTVTSAIVTALEITPATASIAKGLAQQFTATATLSDGSILDVTNNAALSWVSSNPSSATIVSSQASGNGLATGINTGIVTITASGTANGTPFTADAQLTVTDAIVTGLQVTPATASIAKGLTQQFTATVTLSDGATQDVTNNAALSWVSSNPSIATIVSSQASGNGLATGINTGTVTLTASGTANGTPFTADAQLTITSAVVTALQVTPATASVAEGLPQQFTATAMLSDGSTQNVTNNAALSWVSSDPSIATISSSGADKGRATGVASGVVTITASGSAGGTPFSATAQLEVRNVTKSQIFGAVGVGDQTISYLLGASRRLSFRCGSIVDAMGTPEGGMTGGSGGGFFEVSGDNVASIDVNWGFYSGNPGFTSITRIIIRYTDNSSFQCGNNGSTSSIQSGSWAVPLGERFDGFIISAQRFTHALRVASVAVN